MKTKLLQIVLLATTFFCSAQNKNYWQLHDAQNTITATDKAVARQSFPKEFLLFDLNTSTIRTALFSTLENGNPKSIIISLPNVSGQLEEFSVVEASNFEPDLQAQFPEIRAYSGKGITDKYATLKLSISPQGIQTMIFRTDKENEFIEPYSLDHTTYAVFKSTRAKGNLAWSCTTDEKNLVTNISKDLPTSENRFSDTVLRTFRLAQSCNGEYSNYFGATSNAQVGLVLAAFNATLTRCNGVYEKDLAMHLNLVAGSTNIIYYAPATDPYTTMANWNTQLQNAISTRLTGVGTSLAANNAAYDIGHMFGATGGGGNAGCIGCICVNAIAAGTGGTKGRGITSPSDGVPQGDTFDIDYVVHEIGHQIGGTHTFSHNNEGSGTNMEVGSGISIMAYAGITNNDVVAHSIDKYHAVSIAQIQANLQTKTCGITTNISGANATPIVSAGPDYTIPKSTSYILTAVGSDANAADALTYSWEQYDDGAGNTGTASSANATKTAGPNFLSWDDTATPSRYFPKIESVVANLQTTNQVGGDAGMLSEALSSVARDLNFRVTVRDNAIYSSSAPISVGQTNFDDMKITVSAAAGPFVVNSPNTAVTWVAGTNQNVTWTVAGTTSNGVNSPFVDIFLSTDGGYTYPIQLANKVPNDGSEIVTVPNNIGTNNRIMVKGNNHVFFDISNTAFTITAPSSTFAVTQSSEQAVQGCSVSSASFTFSYASLAGFSGTTSFAATGAPAGATLAFSPTTANANGTVTLTIGNLNGISGNFSILVNATSGTISRSVPFYLFLGLGNPTLLTPTNNAATQNTSLPLNWTNESNATSYDVQIATDANFANIISSGNTTSNSYNVTGLAQATSYFWRVAPKNSSCTGLYGAAFKFTTGNVNCATSTNTTPLAIPATITAAFVGTSTLNVPAGSAISDVNVNMNITHTWINDLTVSLTSPAGTTVQIFARQCSPTTGINDVNATFDDAGVPIVCGNSPGISGTVLPGQPLSAFNGQNPVGNWILTVRDDFNGDGGAVNSWGLEICNLSTLSTISNAFENFVLYPNPNSGLFNIKFQALTNQVSVAVFDIRGRSVYNKLFDANGLFENQIDLNNISSGIYLVNIKDGDQTVVKKIVVE